MNNMGHGVPGEMFWEMESTRGDTVYAKGYLVSTAIVLLILISMT